jgi:hypothetical protein
MSTAVTRKKPDKPRMNREQLRAMTELERQDYYLSRLPKPYKFPLFNGRQAVESQRASNYRTTARAAREIVDNAIEAGAKNVRIIFDEPSEDNRERHERKNTVRAIAFIDDGPGMKPEMIQYAVTWGGGTHADDPVGIGKYGFGLPNASIHQTTHFEVYSRVDADGPWHRVALDIEEVDEFGEVNAPDTEEAELPGFVAAYLERNRIELGTGTVVIWLRPDRLTYSTASNLKEHLLDDFGVTYRYLLPRYETDPETKRQKLVHPGKVRVLVQEKPVEAIDPLFLTPGARLYLPPDKEEPEKGGAWETFGGGKTDGRVFAVKWYVDRETRGKKMVWLRTDEELDAARQDPTTRGIGYIHIRVSRMPVGFVDGTIGAKKSKSIPYQRFEVRQARRGVSFVRAEREIETLDAFPRSAHDRASGLGDWPHISTYAYHFAVEIRFDPELDEAFGVAHDKQSVRPCDDFWRIMTSEGIELDKAIRAEEKYQADVRARKIRTEKDPVVTDPTKTAPAEKAAEAASTALGEPKRIVSHRAAEAARRLEEAARKRAELNNESIEVARKAIAEETERKRFRIGYFNSDGGVFYKPDLGYGTQRVAMINKGHSFYQTFYTRLAAMPDPIARQTVDLLLLALANAELTADEDVAEMYELQRESKWSPFLKHGLKKLEGMEHQQDEEDVNGQ